MHFLKMATKLEYSGNGIWVMSFHTDHKIEVSKKQFVMAAVASVNQISGVTITDDDTYYVDGIPKFKGYCTDVFFEEAMKFIVKNKENTFVCVNNAPHSPFNIGKKYRDLYKNKTTILNMLDSWV